MDSRRALLRGICLAGAAGPAGLAGCTGAPNGDTDDDSGDGTDDGNGTGDTDGSSPTDRERPADATHAASIASRDGDTTLPVSTEVAFVDPYVTAGSPAVLRVDVENPTDEAVTIGEYREVVFQYVVSEDETLIWLPHSERSTEGDPDRSTPSVDIASEGCWRLDSYPVVTEEYGTVAVPADGTLTAFVGLYATPDAPASATCFPTGDSRFEAIYTVFPEGIGGEGEERTEWGFDVSVESLDGDG